MDDSIAQLAGDAEINDFLSTLAYRFTRERLKAMGRAHGAPDAQSEVLFIGLGDSGRGQIASALLTLRSKGRVVAHSAGQAAAQSVDPAVVAVMQELGVDLFRGLREAALTRGAGRGGRSRDDGPERRDGRHSGEHTPRRLARGRSHGSLVGRSATRSRRHRSAGAGAPREPRGRDRSDSRAGLAAGSRKPIRIGHNLRPRHPRARGSAPRRSTSLAPKRGRSGLGQLSGIGARVRPRLLPALRFRSEDCKNMTTMSQRTAVPTVRFDATLYTIDKWTILRLPEKASGKLPSRGQVAVQGTINGHGFQTVLEPDVALRPTGSRVSPNS